MAREMVLSLFARGQIAFLPVPILTFSLALHAQTQWTLARANSFGEIYSHAMAFDDVRARAVVFGGYSVAMSSYLAETREWDGQNWIRRTPPNSPPARASHSMAYDAARSSVVLFGGNRLGQLLGDTWTWDGSTWRSIVSNPSPSPRQWAAMAYDGRRQVVVLFGGFTPQQVEMNDTWEWDGSQWTQRQTSTSPPARSQHGMAYDSARGFAVLFGGASGISPSLGDTWEWDGVAWRQATPLNSPGPRQNFACGYDSYRQRIVLFGGIYLYLGYTVYGDTWEWEGSTWIQRGPTTSPPAMVYPVMAFDSTRRESLLYGGSSPFAALQDQTWRYSAVVSANSLGFGGGCAGSTGTPTLAAEGGRPPWLGETFTLRLSGLPANAPAFLFFGFSRTSWAGVPLPVDLTPIGLTGCSLYVDIPLVFTAANQTGSAAFMLPIPVRPDLLGYQFFTQGFCVDPLANPFGATLSNGLANTIGGR